MNEVHISLCSTLILPTSLLLGLHRVASSLQVFRFKVCMHFSHACYMSRRSYPPWFDNFNICWRLQIMKFLIMQFYTSYFHFCQVQMLSSHPIVYVLPLEWETNIHIHTKQNVKFQFLYFNLYIFNQEVEDKSNLKWLSGDCLLFCTCK